MTGWFVVAWHEGELIVFLQQHILTLLLLLLFILYYGNLSKLAIFLFIIEWHTVCFISLKLHLTLCNSSCYQLHHNNITTISFSLLLSFLDQPPFFLFVEVNKTRTQMRKQLVMFLRNRKALCLEYFSRAGNLYHWLLSPTLKDPSKMFISSEKLYALFFSCIWCI